MTDSRIKKLFSRLWPRPLAEDREEFREILDREWVPVLTEMGFTRRRPHWRRLQGPFIDCVNLQHSKWHDECCVNLGVHLVFLPLLVTSEMPDPARLKEVECAFRDRLTPWTKSKDWWRQYGGGDYWWKYRNPQKNARHLIDTFVEYADSYLRQFDNFPQPFDSVTTEDARRDRDKGSPGQLFVWAHVHLHLQYMESARKFAQLGLDRVRGNDQMSDAFQKIIDRTSSSTETN